MYIEHFRFVILCLSPRSFRPREFRILRVPLPPSVWNLFVIFVFKLYLVLRVVATLHNLVVIHLPLLFFSSFFLEIVVIVFFVHTVAHESNQTLVEITKIFKHSIIYYSNKSKYSVEPVSTLIICMFKMVILAIYQFFTKYEYKFFMINIRTLS